MLCVKESRSDCAGPFHQFDRYYKDGGLDDCRTQMHDLRFCVKLKFADPATTKVGSKSKGAVHRIGSNSTFLRVPWLQVMVKELLEQQRKSSTEGVVWEPRSQNRHTTP